MLNKHDRLMSPIKSTKILLVHPRYKIICDSNIGFLSPLSFSKAKFVTLYIFPPIFAILFVCCFMASFLYCFPI